MADIASEENVRCRVERIFDVISDLGGQDRWLAKPVAFRGITDISPDSVEFTTFCELGPLGVRQGTVVTEYDRPSKITFCEPMSLRAGKIDITVCYTLTPSDGSTRVERVVTIRVPWQLKLLQPLMVRAIRANSRRTLLALRAYCEQDSQQRYPGEVGAAAWIDSIGGWASPLLGGFSLASVVVVVTNTKDFRWPGAAILALTIAALILILSVQTAPIARRSLTVRADLPIWGQVHDLRSKPQNPEEAYRARDEALVTAKTWYKRARLFYHCGIIALLIGLALVLVPTKEEGIEAALQWIASAAAAAAGIAEIIYRLRQKLLPWRKKSQTPWWPW